MQFLTNFRIFPHGRQTYDTFKVLSGITLSHHLGPAEVRKQTWALKSHDRNDPECTYVDF